VCACVWFLESPLKESITDYQIGKDARVSKERRRVFFCVCVSPIHMNTCEYMLRPRSAQVMVTVTVTVKVTVTAVSKCNDVNSRGHSVDVNFARNIMCIQLMNTVHTPEDQRRTRTHAQSHTSVDSTRAHSDSQRTASQLALSRVT
jgi:hypothetical protein